MDITIWVSSASITNAVGMISAEPFTFDELHWLQHQMWLLANTTVSEKHAAFAAHAECVFAALTNDTDAIILHTPFEE